MRRGHFLLFIFILSSFFISNVWAANEDIVINEIGAFPTNTHEWVEVWNRGNSLVDLRGWKFWENSTNHGIAIGECRAAGCLMPTTSALMPGQYGAIVQDSSQFWQDFPLFPGVVFDSAWSSLSESGEEIGLKDSSGAFVEDFVYLPSARFSLERRDPFSSDYSGANWQESAVQNTLGFVNSNFFHQTALLNNEASSTADMPASSTAPVESFNDAAQTSSMAETSPTYGPSSTQSVAADPVSPEPVPMPTSSLWSFIKINEVSPSPGPEGFEWIELFNTASSSLNLNGWTLCDNRASDSCAVYSPTSTIGAHGWVTVYLTSSRLNNSGDSVLLKDPNGTTQDQVTYGGNLTPKTGQSVARATDGGDTDLPADWAITIAPTPNGANSIVAPVNPSALPAPTPQSEAVQSNIKPTTVTPPRSRFTSSTTPLIMTELFPNPAGKDASEEFIELFNRSNSAVTLDGWKIAHSSKKFTLSGTLDAGRFLVLVRTATAISLKNTSDTVALVDPYGDAVDTVSYSGDHQAESYSRNSDNAWHWTGAVTRGLVNVFYSSAFIANVLDTNFATTTQSAPFGTVAGIKVSAAKKIAANKTASVFTIADARGSVKGTIAHIAGRVVALPGTFGKQYLYVSDGDTGIQIFQSKKSFPALSVGSLVKVFGKVSIANGIKRITVKSVHDVTVTSDTSTPTATPYSLDEISDDSLGTLVEVEGEITDIKNSRLYLDDGNAEIIISIKSGTHIVTNEFVKGQQVRIVGVLEETKNGLEVWPRNSSDIFMLPPAATANFHVDNFTTQSQKRHAQYFFVTVLGFVALTGVYVIKFKRQAASLVYEKTIGRLFEK